MELPDIERVEVDPAQLAAFSHEDDFLGLAVDLMIEVGQYTVLAANMTDASSTWSRDQAVVGGNIVRLYKLINSVLDQVCQRRSEIAFIIARLTYETVINVRYLIRHHSPELVTSYIAYSLRHEKKQHQFVTERILARNGEPLAIEERMLKSIERSFDAAGITLDQVDSSDKRPWGGKNTRDKTIALGLDHTYLPFFGGGSHNVHGNWQELYGYHLEWKSGDRFSPQPEWNRPRPQIIFTLCILIIEALADYFNFIGGPVVAEHFDAPLMDLHNRTIDVSKAHERYLQTKVWPEI